jgi:hypothetical protein
VPGVVPVPGPARPLLAPEVRARLEPFVAAHERQLPLLDSLTSMFPAGVARGSVLVVQGAPGAGTSAFALQCAAAATQAGEWAAVLDLDGSWGGRAASAAGIAMERCGVVRGVTAEQWPTVVAALLDGMSIVIADLPAHVRAADARRLVARARERASVLVITSIESMTHAPAQWPAEATVRCTVERSQWHGLAAGSGLLTTRDLAVQLDGRGAPGAGARRALALAG